MSDFRGAGTISKLLAHEGSEDKGTEPRGEISGYCRRKANKPVPGFMRHIWASATIFGQNVGWCQAIRNAVPSALKQTLILSMTQCHDL